MDFKKRINILKIKPNEKKQKAKSLFHTFISTEDVKEYKQW